MACCSCSGRTLCFSVSWLACTVCVWRAFRWCHASHGNHNGDLLPCSLSGRLIVLGLGKSSLCLRWVHRPRILMKVWSAVSLQDCSTMWLPGDQWCNWTACVWITVSVLEAVTVSVFTHVAYRWVFAHMCSGVHVSINTSVGGFQDLWVALCQSLHHNLINLTALPRHTCVCQA